jgi:protein SCO1/2
LRGLTTVDGEGRALLIAASERLEVRDEVVQSDVLEHAPATAPRTARSEIETTLAVCEKAPACCCGGGAKPSPRSEALQPIFLCPSVLSRVVVEDQSEQRTPLLPLLRNRTSLIAFFYTRCMNPAKCSLTISRLAELTRHASVHPQRT